MDPNVTLETMLSAIAGRDRGSFLEYSEYLSSWVRKGGFLPDALAMIAEDIADCAQSAAGDLPEDEEERYIDFRIYVRPCGTIELSTGDASYDSDHSGFCGAGTCAPNDSIETVRDSVWRALDDALDCVADTLY